MNSAVNELVQAITGKNSLGECSVIELQQVTNQYPHFGPAQFLLTKKLKEEGSSQYETYLQKISLYFSNPLWLHFLINNKDSDEVTAEFSPKVPDSEPTQNTEAEKKQAIDVIHEQEELTESVASLSTTEKVVEPEEEKNFIGPDTKEPDTSFSEPVNEQTEKAEESLTEVSANLENQPEIIEDKKEEESSHEFEISEEATVIDKEQFAQIESAKPEEVIEPAQTLQGEPELANEQLSAINTVEEEVSQLEKEHQDKETIQPLVEMPTLKIEPIKESDKALTFEPFHTVDYFASQGIKFREEEKPKDKFGQQLKSFTEWLKTLKKLPDAEVAAAPVVSPDQKIEQMAEKSLADGNVITEAMADVWEKQGNPEKAIEIYNKLSLSDPAKSSYFAAKIEQLKHS